MAKADDPSLASRLQARSVPIVPYRDLYPASRRHQERRGSGT